jgi:hypothetical protein
MSGFFDENQLVREKLGRRIADLLARNKATKSDFAKTQTELAEKLGWSQGKVSDVTNAGYITDGRNRPHVKDTDYGPIARALGVTVKELISGIGYTGEPVEINAPNATMRLDLTEDEKRAVLERFGLLP